MVNINQSPRYKYSIVCCARWEQIDVVEWVAYHKALGFDHIFLYSNDDDPTAMSRALLPYLMGDDPFVTLKHFPKPDQRTPQQPDIYRHFLVNEKHSTEWFCFLDVDEFIVLKNVDNIHVFMTRFESVCDAVYFNWAIFGHNGKMRRDDDSVVLSHTQRMGRIDIHTKMITRSSKIDGPAVLAQYKSGKKGFWHFWSEYDIEDMRQMNVLGQDVAGYALEFPQSAMRYLGGDTSARLLETAYVAHYQFRSEDDFLRRVRRGGSNTNPLWQKKIDEGTHLKMLTDRNAVADPYPARFWLKHCLPAFDVALKAGEGAPVNLALRRPSYQSSAFRPEAADQVPEGSASQTHANNGVRNGVYGFRTTMEAQPWWIVDLLDEAEIGAVVLYDCWKSPGLSGWTRHIVVEISSDRKNWTTIHRAAGTQIPFKGPAPFEIAAPTGVRGRFVRLSSSAPASLALCEIEVLGVRPA